MSEEKINLELTKAEALVLFEMLARENEDDSSAKITANNAEKVILWRLEGMLERILVEPFQDDYLELVDKARLELEKEGWMDPAEIREAVEEFNRQQVEKRKNSK